MITKWEIYKAAQMFLSEFDPADFSPEELELLGAMTCDMADGVTPEELRSKYFDFYDDIKDRTLNKHKWSD